MVSFFDLIDNMSITLSGAVMVPKVHTGEDFVQTYSSMLLTHI